MFANAGDQQGGLFHRSAGSHKVCLKDEPTLRIEGFDRPIGLHDSDYVELLDEQLARARSEARSQRLHSAWQQSPDAISDLRRLTDLAPSSIAAS